MPWAVCSMSAINGLPGEGYLTYVAGHENYNVTPEQRSAMDEDRARWYEATRIFKPVRDARKANNAAAAKRARADVSLWLTQCPDEKREDMRRRINVLASKLKGGK